MYFSPYFVRFWRLFILISVALMMSYVWLKQARAQAAWVDKAARLPVTTLAAGMYLIKAEVAANEAEREQGLMFRKKLGPNEGMLFVFDQIERHCFWMKNTKIPLAIAFIDAQGMISDIDEMQADSKSLHCPTQAGRYALEMESGWFTAKDIKPGVSIRGLPH